VASKELDEKGKYQNRNCPEPLRDEDFFEFKNVILLGMA